MDTFRIVEALDSIENKKEVVCNKTYKPDLIKYLEYWNMITINPSANYTYQLTPEGSRVLESQKVKQFRRKHLFDFLSKLNSEIEKKNNHVWYIDESRDGSLWLETGIPYNRTVAERRILDEIAKESRMKIETEGEPQGFSRVYIFKNERAQTNLHSVKEEYVFNRRTVKRCDPLHITVYPSKPISPAEKLITLLVERLER